MKKCPLAFLNFGTIGFGIVSANEECQKNKF